MKSYIILLVFFVNKLGTRLDPRLNNLVLSWTCKIHINYSCTYTFTLVLILLYLYWLFELSIHQDGDI